VIDGKIETVISGMTGAHLHHDGWQSMDQSGYFTNNVATGGAQATVSFTF